MLHIWNWNSQLGEIRPKLAIRLLTGASSLKMHQRSGIAGAGCSHNKKLNVHWGCVK